MYECGPVESCEAARLAAGEARLFLRQEIGLLPAHSIEEETFDILRKRSSLKEAVMGTVREEMVLCLEPLPPVLGVRLAILVEGVVEEKMGSCCAA